MEPATVRLALETVGNASTLATITIDREDKRNALNFATMQALDHVVDELATIPTLTCVLLRGAGEKAFVAGGDLTELANVRTLDGARKLAEAVGPTLQKLANLPAITIAGVNGHAIGGGTELVLACDLRVMARHARLMFRQMDFGVIPAWGSLTRLVKALGQSEAIRILLLERDLTAEEAHTLGLVFRVYQSETFDHDLVALGRQVASLPPIGVRTLKHVASKAHDLPFDAAYALEAEGFAQTWSSADHWEAMAAFFEKRPPQYTGT